MKVLWLPSWYPSKIAPFNGDFIQRYAEAVSLYDELDVIYVVKDEAGKYTRTVLTEITTKGKLTETIIYYYIPPLPIIHKFLSAFRYRQVYKKAIKHFIDKNGRPDIAHVQVGMNAGALALWLLQEHRVPYVLTEHWTGFLDEAPEKFERLARYIRSLWKNVARQALSVSFVSKHLLNAYIKKIQCRNTIIIPNVVNTSVFYPTTTNSTSPSSFIHISGLDERKNPQHLIEAFKIVVQHFPDARLQIFGSTRNDIHSLIRKLDLEKNVSMAEEVSQDILAERIRQSTALVLYSNCETFGCVIIEANACGIPVIVSDIPVFHETVDEGINGLFAKPNEPTALAARMIDVINNRSVFDSEAIQTMTVSKYDYQVVGKRISDWYRDSLKNA